MKSKRIDGDFRNSNYYDHGKDVNEFGIIKYPPRDNRGIKKQSKNNKKASNEEMSTRS